MKELLVLFMLSVCYMGFDQLQEGVVIYEQKVNMHRRITNPEMKAMIPEYNTSKMQLIFNASESLYKNFESEEEDVIEGGNGAMQFRMMRPKNETYCNTATAQKLEMREFMGKRYLIKGEITQTPWKVTGEMEQVAGYNCMKATLTDTTAQGDLRNVIAWFTPDIPRSIGPGNFGSLPGMILKVDINEGETILTAVKIDGRSLKKNELEAPSKGKEVTEEEFRAMVEEQMKQMGGQGGRMIIRN